MKKRHKIMKSIFSVLIADRNSNVLSFVKRELVETGYRVCTANDIRTLMGLMSNNEKQDLVIIDPVFPGICVCLLLRELKERNPDLPIIIHAYMSDFYDHPSIIEGAFFIEKAGCSIVTIKKLILDIINNRGGFYIEQ